MAGKTFVIAEIGTSHQGDISMARDLIDAARDSGADAAKFQWVYADEIIHPLTGNVALPTGNIALYDKFLGFERGPDFFAELKSHCDEVGIEFFCTPFGLRSARELSGLGVSRYKIASPELNHHALLEFVGSTGKQVFLSSGVSTLGDIDEALAVLRCARDGKVPMLDALHVKAPSRSSSDGGGICLLHCMTVYPAPEEEYNLRLVRTLSSIFGLATGISDHSLDPLLVPLISVLMGGTAVEKHFTLSRSTDGLDDPIALVPSDFGNMTRAIREAEAFLGTASAPLSDDDMFDYLRVACPGIDRRRFDTMLGTGIKTLAPSERANYGRTNRSIHALRELPAGTRLGPENCAVLRTEKILRPGLHPRYVPAIFGKRLKRHVPSGEGILWDDLLLE